MVHSVLRNLLFQPWVVAQAVIIKLDGDNLRAIVRLVRSDDVPVSPSEETLASLSSNIHRVPRWIQAWLITYSVCRCQWTKTMPGRQFYRFQLVLQEVQMAYSHNIWRTYSSAKNQAMTSMRPYLASLIWSTQVAVSTWRDTGWPSRRRSGSWADNNYIRWTGEVMDLSLNDMKCEIIARQQAVITDTIRAFSRVNTSDATLLRAPLFAG